MNPLPLKLMNCVALLVTGLLVVPASAQNSTVLKTQADKDSYAVGADLARNLKRRGVPMEAQALLKGMEDVLTGAKLLMSDDDLRETLRALQTQERQKVILARKGNAPVGDDNAERGAAFLSLNKTNLGVVCLPSGLQYRILQTGTGPRPKETDTVQCRFHGTLIDGREFAGSDPDKPATLKVSEVIPGWKEALQLMAAGSKWQLFVPPQLAYGVQGAGRARLAPRIGPNATLIYELELLAIK